MDMVGRTTLLLRIVHENRSTQKNPNGKKQTRRGIEDEKHISARSLRHSSLRRNHNHLGLFLRPHHRPAGYRRMTRTFTENWEPCRNGFGAHLIYIPEVDWTLPPGGPDSGFRALRPIPELSRVMPTLTPFRHNYENSDLLDRSSGRYG